MTPALEPWWWALETLLAIAPFFAVLAVTGRGRN